jgi:hypothetical protein
VNHKSGAYDRDVATRDDWSALRNAARIVGIAFLLAGIGGFIPGLTVKLDQIKFMGQESDAELLGLFQVSVLHNIVHLAFGVAGLVMSRTRDGARTFLIGGGLIYLALALYDALVKQETSLNFLPTNNGDAWLHLGLGTAMLALGLLLARRREQRDVTAGRREPVTVRSR